MLMVEVMMMRMIRKNGTMTMTMTMIVVVTTMMRRGSMRMRNKCVAWRIVSTRRSPYVHHMFLHFSLSTPPLTCPYPETAQIHPRIIAA